MVANIVSSNNYAVNVCMTHHPIPTFLFFSKTIFEIPILDIYICPFFKILETFIKWKEKQGIWEKVTFLHDGLKKIGSHSFCEHTFFWRFPDNHPLCQYFPLLRPILGNSPGLEAYNMPKVYRGKWKLFPYPLPQYCIHVKSVTSIVATKKTIRDTYWHVNIKWK